MFTYLSEGVPNNKRCRIFRRNTVAVFLCRCGTIRYDRSKAEVVTLVERVLECRGRRLNIIHGGGPHFSVGIQTYTLYSSTLFTGQNEGH